MREYPLKKNSGQSRRKRENYLKRTKKKDKLTAWLKVEPRGEGDRVMVWSKNQNKLYKKH